MQPPKPNQTIVETFRQEQRHATGRIELRLPMGLKSACVKAARPGKLNDWLLNVLALAAGWSPASDLPATETEPVVHHMNQGNTACGLPVARRPWPANHYWDRSWPVVTCPLCLKHKPT